jgi:hypothetical protein
MVLAIVCSTISLRSTDVAGIVDWLRRPRTATPRLDVDGTSRGGAPRVGVVMVVVTMTAGRAGVDGVLLAKRLAPVARPAQVEARVEQPAEEQEPEDGANDDARNGSGREPVIVVIVIVGRWSDDRGCGHLTSDDLGRQLWDRPRGKPIA